MAGGCFWGPEEVSCARSPAWWQAPTWATPTAPAARRRRCGCRVRSDAARPMPDLLGTSFFRMHDPTTSIARATNRGRVPLGPLGHLPGAAKIAEEVKAKVDPLRQVEVEGGDRDRRADPPLRAGLRAPPAVPGEDPAATPATTCAGSPSLPPVRRARFYSTARCHQAVDAARQLPVLHHVLRGGPRLLRGVRPRRRCRAGAPPRRPPCRQGHASRFEGRGVLFHASDNHDAEPMRGSAHYLTLDARDQTTHLFTQLAVGGTVTTPLGIQPWSAYYGKLARPLRRAVDAHLCRVDGAAPALAGDHGRRSRWPRSTVWARRGDRAACPGPCRRAGPLTFAGELAGC